MAYVDLDGIHDPTAGATAPHTWGAQVNNNFEFLVNPPRARVKRSTAQEIPNNTVTAVLWNQEDYDTDTLHDTGSGTSLFTVQTAGLYTIRANIQFEADADGFRFVQITHGDDGAIGATILPLTGAAVTPSLYVETDYVMAVGDTVRVDVWHTAGAALDVETASRFSIRWVAA